MNKRQAIKFWQDLHDTTEQKEVIARLMNKKGYAGERTLVRYAQVDDYFRQGIPLPDIAKKVGWKEDLVEKLFLWWKEQFVEPSSSQAPPDQLHLEHWARLGKVAEALKIGLEFNRGMEETESRFGGIVWGNWKFDPKKIMVILSGDHYIEKPKMTPEVSFSAQDNKLWEHFMAHMNVEFLSFSSEFTHYLDIASSLVKADLGQELQPVRSCPETEALKQKLWLVIERRTFKGKCKICKDWT